MTDALEQAKALQHDAAITTTVRVPLDVLEGLIAEIERLKPLHDGMDRVMAGRGVREVK
jgi:hypothetical protein